LPSRNPQQRFADILADIDFLQQHTASIDLSGFASNKLILYAAERVLSRISEAATRLMGQAESLAPEQPWQQIRALGNRIRHEYDHLDAVVLWEIIQNDLPALKTTCERVLGRTGTQAGNGDAPRDR
jgi:uncharacterized protein with HEPN domain